MKLFFARLAILLFLFFLPSCSYYVPISKEHNIKIDPEVLGYWEMPWGLAGQQKKIPLLILKFSDTEYAITSISKDEKIYFRGYPIIIGGVSCVQLQVIGQEDEPVFKDKKERYCVITYQLTNNELNINVLSDELINGKTIKDSKHLEKTFLKNIKNKNLFNGPLTFKLVNKKE